MAFESAFLDLMTSRVTIKPFNKFDGYGSESFGTSVLNVPAHILEDSKITRGSEFEDISTTGYIWLPPPGFIHLGTMIPSISENDHIVLPDSSEHRVHSVELAYDEDGSVHHIKVTYI